jgi:hypothetical protein
VYELESFFYRQPLRSASAGKQRIIVCEFGDAHLEGEREQTKRTPTNESLCLKTAQNGRDI